jgi:hypothetical protein
MELALCITSGRRGGSRGGNMPGIVTLAGKFVTGRLTTADESTISK